MKAIILLHLLSSFTLILSSFQLRLDTPLPSLQTKCFPVFPNRIPSPGMNSGTNVKICKYLQSTFCFNKYGVSPSVLSTCISFYYSVFLSKEFFNLKIQLESLEALEFPLGRLTCGRHLVLKRGYFQDMSAFLCLLPVGVLCAL